LQRTLRVTTASAAAAKQAAEEAAAELEEANISVMEASLKAVEEDEVHSKALTQQLLFIFFLKPASSMKYRNVS